MSDLCAANAEILGPAYPELCSNLDKVKLILGFEIETGRHLECEGEKIWPNFVNEYPRVNYIFAPFSLPDPRFFLTIFSPYFPPSLEKIRSNLFPKSTILHVPKSQVTRDATVACSRLQDYWSFIKSLYVMGMFHSVFSLVATRNWWLISFSKIGFN